MSNEVLQMQRSTAIPATAPGPKRRLYIAKDTTNGLNIAMDDTSGVRPARALREVQLSGPPALYQSMANTVTQGTYKIENYDSFTTYTATVSAGAVSLSGDTLTVTSPTTPGNIYLTVNGEHSRIIIKAPSIKKPTVTYPVARVLMNTTFTATSDAFTTSGPGDTCASTTWQVATTADFSTLVINSTTAGQLTSKAMTGLSCDTPYFIRMRYTGTTLGASDWSDTVRFVVDSSVNPLLYAESSKLVASDGSASSFFGYSVAISNDETTLAIGAYGEASLKGSVYIYTLTNRVWTQQAKLTASGGVANDYFGWAVALSTDGNTLVASGYGFNTYLGAGIVFTRSGTTWTQQAKLVPSGGATYDYSGFSVDISGDGNTVLLGAYLNDVRGADSGAAYVFTRSGTTWTQQARLSPTDGVAGDYFGYAVALSGDGNTALIGAVGDDDKGSSSGSAYFFTRSGTTWTQGSRFLAPDGVANDVFGASVAISFDGSTAIVGALEYVYIYTNTGSVWSQQAKLVATDKATGDYFGYSVSLTGNGSMALVGAYRNDDKGVDSGSVYVFTRSAGVWSQQRNLVASDGGTTDYFGFGVAVSYSGSFIIAGAYQDDDKAANAGAAYCFMAG